MNVRTTAMPANLLRLGAGALGLAAVGVLLVQGSEAAFTGSTDNSANAVNSGTVKLSDSDGSGLDGKGAGTAMFNVSNLNGGQIVTRCIKVSYGGSLTADVKLYGTSNGELAQGLAMTIEAGNGTEATGGANFDCAGFTDGSQIFSGSLKTFGENHNPSPDNTYANKGITGHAAATAGTSKSYKITMVVSNDNAYQGKDAAAAFTWVATGRDVETVNN